MCLKNFYARYGESASSQTKVRIRQAKCVELANEWNTTSIFKAYILTDKSIQSAKENYLKMENAVGVKRKPQPSP